MPKRKGKKVLWFRDDESKLNHGTTSQEGEEGKGREGIQMIPGTMGGGGGPTVRVAL